MKVLTIKDPQFEVLGPGEVSCTDPSTGEVGYADDAQGAYKQCLRVKYANQKLADQTA